MDVLFAIDIIVNLRTTFVSEQTGNEVVEPSPIFVNYACSGRFLIDLLASIPFDLLIPASEEDNGNQTALLGSLKLVRLLRLGRIVQYMKMRQGLKLGFKVFQMLGLLILIMHWVGCIHFKFVQDRDSWMPPKDSNDQKTTFYDLPEGEQYQVMFYYAFLLIVGNEMGPKNLYQCIFYSSTIIIGSLLMSFIFGSIAAAMSTMG